MTIGGRQRDLRLLERSRLGSTGLRRFVDLVCAGLTIALFAQVGDPEIILQTLWLTAAVGAFIYGLRAAIARILIASVVVVGFVAVAAVIDASPTADELEFNEWPLMLSIALIVAVLADRVSTSARRYASLYRQASERLVTAHEEERARLALDLHDGVGQTLTAVVLNLDAAENALRTTTSGPAATALDSIHRARDLATAALAETRQVAAQLRPTRVHEIGLGAALRNLAGSAGKAVELRFDPQLLPPGLLEPDLEIDLYRIVQESLGNAMRHSGARQIWIGCHIFDESVRILVGDDGIGFDEGDSVRGLGLAGMYERAAIHGGSVNVRSRRGEGTRVEISVPLTTMDEEALTEAVPRPAVDPAH